MKLFIRVADAEICLIDLELVKRLLSEEPGEQYVVFTTFLPSEIKPIPLEVGFEDDTAPEGS